MTPQEFQLFLQEYPDIIPYIQEDPSLMQEIILNPQFREQAKSELVAMRAPAQAQVQEMALAQAQAPAVTQDPYGRKTNDGYAPTSGDGWDFSNNRKMYSPDSLAKQGGEAGTVGRDDAVNRVYGNQEATEYSWQPSYMVNSPSGMSYIMGEAQAKQAFKNMLDGGYARPQDYDKLITPTGNTMKTYDLKNTNIGLENNQKHFQYRNEQYAKDPDAEMMRRATNMDDIKRNEQYRSTGNMAPPDTYTKESWDTLTSQKRQEESNINSFVQSGGAKHYAPQPPPQTPVNNAGSQKAPIGVKTQPKINIPTNLNNIKQNVTKTISSGLGSSKSAKGREPIKSNTQVKTPYQATTSKGMSPAQVKASSSPLQKKVISKATTLKDKLLSSLRKGK